MLFQSTLRSIAQERSDALELAETRVRRHERNPGARPRGHGYQLVRLRLGDELDRGRALPGATESWMGPCGGIESRNPVYPSGPPIPQAEAKLTLSAVADLLEPAPARSNRCQARSAALWMWPFSAPIPAMSRSPTGARCRRIASLLRSRLIAHQYAGQYRWNGDVRLTFS